MKFPPSLRVPESQLEPLPSLAPFSSSLFFGWPNWPNSSLVPITAIITRLMVLSKLLVFYIWLRNCAHRLFVDFFPQFSSVLACFWCVLLVLRCCTIIAAPWMLHHKCCIKDDALWMVHKLLERPEMARNSLIKIDESSPSLSVLYYDARYLVAQCPSLRFFSILIMIDLL